MSYSMDPHTSARVQLWRSDTAFRDPAEVLLPSRMTKLGAVEAEIYSSSPSLSDPGDPGSERDTTGDDDLSALEYARLYGLTRDHTLDGPRMTAPFPLTPESMYNDLAEPPNLLNLGTLVSLGALNGHTIREKWDVDMNAAKFLASIIRFATEDDSLDDVESSSHLKLEEPLLSADPGLDLLSLKQRNTMKLSTAGMLPFQLDNRHGEDSNWSVEELRLPSEKDQQVAQEKLEIDAETINYLKEIWGSINAVDDDFPMIKYVTAAAPGPITPPLMPLSPQLKVQGISAVAAQLELTSTPEDLISLEAANLEREILHKDDSSSSTVFQIPEPAPSIRDPATNFVSLEIGNSSSPVQRKRLQDIKLDVPLLPAEVDRPPKRVKTVSFSEELHALVPTSELNLAMLDVRETDEDNNSLMDDFMAPFEEAAIQQIENEQLLELDTTERLIVPEVEEIELYKPWDAFRSAATAALLHRTQTDFMSRMKTDFCKMSSKWGGASKAEKLLPWAAFPSVLGKVQEEELDDGSLARYLAEPSFDGTLDIDSLLSYQPFDIDAEQDLDELQPALSGSPSPEPEFIAPSATPPTTTTKVLSADIPVRMDMRALLRQRKMEIEAASRLKLNSNQPTAADTDQLEQGHKSRPLDVTTGDRFAGRGLMDFIRLHGGDSQSEILVSGNRERPTHQIAPLAVVADPRTQALNAISNHQSACPTPKTVYVGHQAFIIVSSALTSRRELMRALHTALPTVEVIERSPISSPAPGSTRTVFDYHEADVTVSPSTGILTTTLQKLKQKPLPGQSSFYGVHERVNSVSARYARLIVLVSGGYQTSNNIIPGDNALTASIDQRDTEALADLIGLATKMACDIQVIYVPGGAVQLEQWTIALISRLVPPAQETTLLQDETMWERFLRRAGMNGFAAQTVLAKLKGPKTKSCTNDLESPDGSDTGPHGLSAFLQMSNEQRVERLEATINSRDVLKTVGDCVNGRWITQPYA